MFVLALVLKMKVLVAAANKSLYYKDLMALHVCNITYEKCMLKWCNDCPSPDNLRKHISDIFHESSDNGDDISYTQWENTDRTNINLFQLQFQDFIDELVEVTIQINSPSFHFKARTAPVDPWHLKVEVAY